MKKSLKWALLLVVIIIVAAILYLIWITIFDTKWLDLKRQTYENSRYGFSLKYPQEWILGEQETNNAGREFYSPNREVFCYAYGFANALMNDQEEPQTLDEFIVWLTDEKSYSGMKEVLYRENSTLAGKPAIRLLIEEETAYKQAFYTLGKETGIGFYCIYPDMDTIKKYANKFGQMIMSFEIKADLDGEAVKTGIGDCVNLLNGAIVPLKDLQIFTDTKYTGVTLISRENWDRNLLPGKVIDLESNGYTCYPMPLEFKDTASGGDVHAQPMVTKVEWQCELEYSDWKYLSADSNEVSTYRNNGFKCEKEECFLDNNQTGSVWLCSK